MRLSIVPLLMSAALFAAPAFAQSSTTATSPSSSPSGTSDPSREQGVTMDTQQKIRHSLEQNGFKNVQVIPQSFVIRAQAPDGSRLVMEVSPDQFEEIIAPPMRSGSSGSRSGSNLGSGSSATGTNSLGSTSGGTGSMSGSSPGVGSTTATPSSDTSPNSSSSNSSSTGTSR